MVSFSWLKWHQLTKRKELLVCAILVSVLIIYLTVKAFEFPRFTAQTFEAHFTCPISPDINLSLLPQALVDLKRSEVFACRSFHSNFYKMFRLEHLTGSVVLPKIFSNKLLSMLGNEELLSELKNQQNILKIFHLYTYEESIFCALRGKRPTSSPRVSEVSFTLDSLVESTENCDFCFSRYLNLTAMDEFGHMETSLSYTTANAFKYDKWHSLVFSRNHNPLNLTYEELKDMFILSENWLAKVYNLDPKARYPVWMWDAMPKSGASQVHTHLHISLGRVGYPGVAERLRMAAQNYQSKNPTRNYFIDFVDLHVKLGLALIHGASAFILNLNSMKDFEFIIISSVMDDSFYELLHAALQAFIEDLKKYSFSLGAFSYPMGVSDKEKSSYVPPYCRVVFRDYASQVKNDFNGLDLHMSSILSVDKFSLMRQLKPNILKRLTPR